MEREYGFDQCPLPNRELVEKAIEKYGDEIGLCYDYDRLGTIACGICGANNELAQQGRRNVIAGIMRQINNKE